MLPLSQLHQSHRAFFNISTNSFHFLCLPKSSSRIRLCGSSHGSLVLLDQDSPQILLLNPLMGAKTHLPPLPAFPNIISFSYSDVGGEYVLRAASRDVYTRSLREMWYRFVKKVVLSCSPFKDGGFIAMTILSQTGELAYCRSGDQSWKIIPDVHDFCEDVIFLNGFFYAVNKEGQVVVCHVGDDDPSPRVFLEIVPQIGSDMQYLVSSGDELLLVSRYLDLDFVQSDNYLPYLIYRTRKFVVFGLDDSRRLRWERMRSLGDRALFVGANSSLSLLASAFYGCMGNCIYYTDDYSDTNYEGEF